MSFSVASDFWPILLLAMCLGILVVLLTVVVFALFGLSRRTRQLIRALRELSNIMQNQVRLSDPRSALQQLEPVSSTAGGTPTVLGTRGSAIDVRTQLRALQETILSDAAKRPLVGNAEQAREE